MQTVISCFRAGWVLVLMCGLPVTAPAAPGSAFNALVLEKAALEHRHGVTRLECFPFLEDIGEDQARWVEHCLQGARTLAGALAEVPDADLSTVGISTRFLRTGGFHTLLVRWDASSAEMVEALRARPTPEEQQRLIDEVGALKRAIQGRLFVAELYCTQTISNDQCLEGYRALAQAAEAPGLRNRNWARIEISGQAVPVLDAGALSLSWAESPAAMVRQLTETPAEGLWTERRKTYEIIQEEYGDAFKALQLPNFFCAPDLTGEECREGAAHLAAASASEVLRRKKWGEVRVHRHNTLIRNDYDVVLRYDLPAEGIVAAFSGKPDGPEVEAQVTRAEKLETRVKNNTAGLRGVCDLGDLPSALCLRGFESFIGFLKARRDYRAALPWTDLMFIDGRQLARVNFALNSKSRDTYIYIDAHSTPEEFARHLTAFGRESAGGRN